MNTKILIELLKFWSKNLAPKASEKVKYVTNKEDYEILNELEENKNEQNEANIDISSEQIEKGLDELEDIEYEIDEDEKDEELIVEEIKADKVFGGKIKEVEI